MDRRLTSHTIRALPSVAKPIHRFSVPNSVENSQLSRLSSGISRRRSSIVSAGRSHCESSSLDTPLEPRSEVGKYLGRVLRRRSSIVSAGRSHCESSSLNTPLEPRSEVGKYIGRVLRRRSSIVSAGRSHCESSSLNTPLEPRTEVGKYLGRVLRNQRQEFHDSVAEELKQLANDRDAAVYRMVLSVGSDEASLHRRIAELKDTDSKTTLQEVMYMLILFKFSEIKVQLVPKLSKCTYNARLHILPPKDWELESIYTSDTLEMVRRHVIAVTGLPPHSSPTNQWTTTQLRKCQLGDIYASSILYGYFLQSVSARHRLEHTLSLSHLDRTRMMMMLHVLKSDWPYGWNNLVFGGKTGKPTVRKLSCYVTGFDSESLQRCAKVKSMEAVGLIEKQTYALFGDANKGYDDVVVTSFSSLKRLVLEAVGFGTFLWDVEEYVDSVYKLNTD